MKHPTKRLALATLAALACLAAADTDELVPRPGVLAVGDLVAVSIHGVIAPDRSETFERHVCEDGHLGLPWVGSIPVRGLTTDRAAGEIVGGLRRANVENNAIVTVGVLRSAGESKIRPGPIAQGDPLRITIFDLTGAGARTEVLAVVGGDGMVELPAAGEVKLEGLSESDADAAVKNRFREKGVLEDAVVAVLRLEPNGKK
jgi:protein involved in polysaccharide export with SLBB domain